MSIVSFLFVAPSVHSVLNIKTFSIQLVEYVCVKWDIKQGYITLLPAVWVQTVAHVPPLTKAQSVTSGAFLTQQNVCMCAACCKHVKEGE